MAKRCGRRGSACRAPLGRVRETRRAVTEGVDEAGPCPSRWPTPAGSCARRSSLCRGEGSSSTDSNRSPDSRGPATRTPHARAWR